MGSQFLVSIVLLVIPFLIRFHLFVLKSPVEKFQDFTSYDTPARLSSKDHHTPHTRGARIINIWVDILRGLRAYSGFCVILLADGE